MAWLSGDTVLLFLRAPCSAVVPKMTVRPGGHLLTKMASPISNGMSGTVADLPVFSLLWLPAGVEIRSLITKFLRSVFVQSLIKI